MGSGRRCWWKMVLSFSGEADLPVSGAGAIVIAPVGGCFASAGHKAVTVKLL